MMLTFYGDDAGKKYDHNYVVAGGYVGLVSQWERFCPDWRLQLASVGLSEFHANEFFNGVGIFAGWEKPERKEERETLLAALAQIIKDYTLQGFCCVVNVPEWYQVNEDYMLDECGFSPFPLGARTVAQCVSSPWCKWSRG